MNDGDNKSAFTRVLDIDRQSKTDVCAFVDSRLAIVQRVADIHLRHFAERLDNRVADEVGK